MYRIVALAFVAFSVSACGHSATRHFGSLSLTTRFDGKLEPTPRPPVAPGSPARNIDDVTFLTPRLGFLVASAGQFDHEPGRIQRTTDGGRTWHDVWRRPKTSFDWVTFADHRHGFAGGDRFILRSSDGGRTWARSRMFIPRHVPLEWTLLDPHFVTPTLGLAVADPAGWAPTFLRTTDGGRRWSRVRGLQDVLDAEFLSTETGFAVGTGLYRTDDGGRSWRRIGSPHVRYTLGAVDFSDSRQGFIGGGYPPVMDEAPSQAVFTTGDGGRTWERRFANPHRAYSPRGGGDPFLRLGMVDSRRGWAATGGCKCCPSGPCVSDIYVTRDGGYSWRRRWSGIQLTSVGANDAWVVDACGDYACDVIWRTTDTGRHWRPIARPDRFALTSVRFLGENLSVDAVDGATFTRHDRRRWTFHPTRAPGEPAVGAVATAYAGRRGFAAVDAVDLGETCRQKRLVVETGRRLYSTRDGGRTWARRRAPFLISALAVRKANLLAVGVRRCGLRLGVSHDGGHSWSVRRLPSACAPAAGPVGDIWLACNRTVASGDRSWTRATILHSTNDGRSWTRIRLPLEVVSLAPRDGREAWAILGATYRHDDLSRLWHTSDGGKTWTELWPAFPARG